MSPNNIKVTQPQTITLNPSEMKEIQIRRFSESLNEILKVGHSPKVEFSERLVQSARIAIAKPLDNAQLNHLCYFADSWNQDVSIEPILMFSNPYIKIQFTLKKN